MSTKSYNEELDDLHSYNERIRASTEEFENSAPSIAQAVEASRLYAEDSEKSNIESSTARDESVTAKDESVAAKDEVLSRVASYEVESTEYLINTFDSSLLEVGDVVKALGYLDAETGASNWVKTASTGTASQSPIELINGKLTTLNGDVFDLVSDGCVNVFSFGAVNSTVSTENSTGAFAAMASHCLSTGDSWVANGDFYVDYVNSYTSTNSNCVLHSSNNGESVGVLNILPDPVNVVTDNDTSALQSELPFHRGQNRIASLGEHKGKVIRVASPNIYLPRSSDLTANYRYEFYCYVINELGDITPTVPFDFPDTINITILKTEVLSSKLEVLGVTTKLTSGVTGNRSASIKSTRSNVAITATSFNESGLFAEQGMASVGVMQNNYIASSSNGCGVNTTNYGYGFSGANNSLVSCSESDNRRGCDQHYHNGLKIIGGEYPSGIGAHFGFDTKCKDVSHIGFTAANATPIHFTGADILFDGCNIVTQLYVMDVRGDGPELLGNITLINSHVTFDLTDYTGSPDLFIFKSTLPSLASAYDAGRDLFMFDRMTVKNNTFKVKGVNHSAQLYAFWLYVNGSSVNDIHVDSLIDFAGNKYIFENGENKIRMTANKLKNFSADSKGITVNFDDHIDTLVTFFGSQYLTSDAKLNLTAPNVHVNANANADYGWLEESYLSNASYLSATGVDYDPESRWMTRVNKQPWHLRKTVLDDEVLIISNFSIYNMVELFRLNSVTLYGKFVIEASGTTTIGSMYSSSNIEVSSLALTGTTGADGKVTISQVGGDLYIENRLGSSIPLILLFTEAV